MSENMQCLVSCSCVSLLGLMVSSFIHIPAKDMNSSFSTAAQYSMLYMCHMCLNRIVGSNGISNSRFLRNRYTVFHNGWTNLHSHQQCKSGSLTPHPIQRLLFLDFLLIAIPNGVRWYIDVVFICISLMTWDDEHFFTSVGYIIVFFWEVSFYILFPFSDGVVFFL